MLEEKTLFLDFECYNAVDVYLIGWPDFNEGACLTFFPIVLIKSEVGNLWKWSKDALCDFSKVPAKMRALCWQIQTNKRNLQKTSKSKGHCPSPQGIAHQFDIVKGLNMDKSNYKNCQLAIIFFCLAWMT